MTKSTNPPGARSSSKQMYRDVLGKKADEKWVESELNALEKAGDETRRIALSAKKDAGKPHSCLHGDDIRALSQAVNGWKNLKFGAILAFLVVSAGATAQYYALKSKTDNTVEAVADFKESVDQVEVQIDDLTEVVESEAKARKEEKLEAKRADQEQVKAMAKVVKSAILEANETRRR